MKHLMTKDKLDVRAWCKRPGCQVSMQGDLEHMTIKDLNEMFSSDCPGVFKCGRDNMTHKESVEYLLEFAKNEIKSWNKIIKYWEHKY